jgi:hypothetical protein
LVCEANKRLTFEGIKSHPFFKDLDWENLRAMKAPIVPTVKDDVDTQNFDKFSHDDAAPDTSAPPPAADPHAKPGMRVPFPSLPFPSALLLASLLPLCVLTCALCCVQVRTRRRRSSVTRSNARTPRSRLWRRCSLPAPTVRRHRHCSCSPSTTNTATPNHFLFSISTPARFSMFFLTTRLSSHVHASLEDVQTQSSLHPALSLHRAAASCACGQGEWTAGVRSLDLR